jgi:hypothetical protein
MNTHTHTHAHTHTHTHAHTHTTHTNRHRHTQTHTRTEAYIHTHVRTHTHIHTQTRTNTRSHTRSNTQPNTNTLTHNTHIHDHKQTDKQTNEQTNQHTHTNRHFFSDKDIHAKRTQTNTHERVPRAQPEVRKQTRKQRTHESTRAHTHMHKQTPTTHPHTETVSTFHCKKQCLGTVVFPIELSPPLCLRWKPTLATTVRWRNSGRVRKQTEGDPQHRVESMYPGTGRRTPVFKVLLVRPHMVALGLQLLNKVIQRCARPEKWRRQNKTGRGAEWAYYF